MRERERERKKKRERARARARERERERERDSSCPTWKLPSNGVTNLCTLTAMPKSQ